MLLPDNIKPEYSIYYLGSFVITAIRRKNRQPLLDLYQDVKGMHDMSFPSFLLCLDWLYLVGFAEINDDGEVCLCSLKD